jgi:deazaflavin-dependent oxidoreductase (nitroreductase family)
LFNVRAEPEVELQVAQKRMPGTARVLEPGDEDYERLWRLANENNHGRYDGYQSHTSRPIPLIVVSPG